MGPRASESPLRQLLKHADPKYPKQHIGGADTAGDMVELSPIQPTETLAEIEESFLEAIKKDRPDFYAILQSQHLTILEMATAIGQTEYVIRMVEAGAPLIQQGESRALHLAVSGGYANIVKILIEGAKQPATKKALLEAKNTTGATAIYLAAKEGRAEILKLLIEHGAKLDVQDMFGYTPWHYAAEQGQVEVFKALKAATKPITARKLLAIRNTNGLTPLHIAIQKHKMDSVEALLEARADPDAELPIEYKYKVPTLAEYQESELAGDTAENHELADVILARQAGMDVSN